MGDDNSSSTDASNLPLAAPSAVTASSPYHLHPSGNPWSLITSFLLSSDNYSEWSTELQNSLQAKQKTGFIDGTIPKPDTDPDISLWLAVN